MTEVAEQDVKTQEVVTPVEATESQKPQEIPEAKSDSERDSREYNWRKMEQKVNELERKNQEMARIVEEKANPPQPAEPDELSQLQADDLVTVSQVDKLAEKRAKKIVDAALAKREKDALPQQTKAKYEDYDQVVTNDNINLLVQEDPDLEHDIQVSKNPFARAYKEIKKSRFYQERMKNKTNTEKIDNNSNKPVSSNTLAKQSPLSHANAFATFSKEELRKEMDQCARRSASVPNMR